MSNRRYTPADLKVLLHYYVSNAPYGDIHPNDGEEAEHE